MPFLYRNLTLSPDQGEDQLLAITASRIGLRPAQLGNFRIIRKGIDARRKPRIKIIYTVSFSLEQRLHDALPHDPSLEWQPDAPQAVLPRLSCDRRIVIVGSGPAGLFSALRLAQYGLTATIIERGKPVEQRSVDVQRFWRDGMLDPESNVQFGEGGAGTFSDGKLTSRARDPLTPWVLEQFASFGAPPEICYLAKPHIGTDRLRKVVAAIRQHLIGQGFQIRFECRMSDITVQNGSLSSIVLNDTEELPCDNLILATGHSSRDTYEMLHRRGILLQRKAFAMGVRVEHPQELIDRIQYGAPRHSGLPAADYAVTWNNATTGRSAYSFCMCPGGIVIGGASEPGGIVTNGMSGQMRNSPFANSALVVNVDGNDFGEDDPLAGIRFQRHWEQQAFAVAGGGYRAPAQNLMDFLGQPGKRSPASSYRPGIIEVDLASCLPEFITKTLREGILDFNRRLRGFITAEATLIGIESRTSAPVRIVRGEQYQSPSLRGLYPTGEGAGYAGGIMSSAIDGIRIADTIAASMGNFTL